MPKRTNHKLIAIIIAAIVFAGIIFGIIMGIRQLIRWFADIAYTVSTMDTVIIIAVISGAVTILGLLVNSIITLRLKHSDYKHNRKVVLLRKLEAPYTQFVNMLFDMVRKKEDAEHIDEDVRNRLLRDMSREIILYGSDDVVKKWVDYKRKAPGFSVEEHLAYLESILHLIRKDMGINQGSLMPGDLLSLFVDDIETIGDNHFHFSFGPVNMTYDFDEDEKTGSDSK